jgi:regulator of replication initiation timing
MNNVITLLLMPFAVSLYKAYKRQGFLVPSLFQFTKLKYFGDENALNFYKADELREIPTVKASKDIADLFETHQALEINKKQWVTREFCLRAMSSMNKELFDIAKNAEKELEENNKVIKELVAQLNGVSEENETLILKLSKANARCSAIERQIQDNNESLIDKNQTIENLAFRLGESEEACEKLAEQVNSLLEPTDKEISKYAATVDLNEPTRTVLDALEQAQGILQTHILPDSKVTDKEAVGALYGVLDNDELVNAQKLLRVSIPAEYDGPEPTYMNQVL